MREVQIRETCPHCENGVVQHPLWEEFWKLPNAQELMKNENEAEFMEWFRERGGTHMSQPYMGKRVELFAEEEIPCPDCEGTAVRRRWVSLEEFAGLLTAVPA